jgi:DNA (cytosine-5)-methyltransferase 1
MYTVGSLFSGIGGFELGLAWAGFGPVLWQVESDAFCREVLRRHWPGTEMHEDVKQVGGRVLRSVDVVCGGFPCQDVSAAGRRAGLSGERSGLWFDAARVIGELLPRAVIIENVASGASLWLCEVRSGLRELGYRTVAYRVLASDVGAPHKRARVFVCGYRSLADAASAGREGTDGEGELAGERRQDQFAIECGDAGADVRAVEPRVGGDVAGFPSWVDGYWPAAPGEERRSGEPARTAGKVANRPARLRALGNAIVPHCAMLVGVVVRRRLELEDAG